MKQKLFLAFAMLMTFCSFCWADDVVISEVDWTLESSFYENVWYDDVHATLEFTANGLEITCNPSENALNHWDCQVPMIANIPDLEKGKNYQVVFTLDAPADGAIRLDLCSWDGTSASNPQDIDVQKGLHEYTVSFDNYPTSCTDAMIFYQCGLMPGKHIIKQVKLWGPKDNRQAYAFLSSDGKTLTFYYDGQRNTREGGTAHSLNKGASYPGWYSNKNVTNVEFTSSFKYARPTSTYSWFYKQKNLVTITGISNLNTSEVTDMGYMFLDCSKLKSLDVSGFNTSKVTSMSSMFDGCSGLTSLNVSRFNTSKVTSMGYMFNDCSGLTSLDLSSFDTSNVEYMYGVFQGCSGLTSLDVSSFDTSKVTSMNGMFWECSKLTSLDVSSFDTRKVTNMAKMFYGCSSLTSLDLSSFDTGKVTDMSYMFYRDNGMTTIYVGNHWTTSSLSTDGGKDMFTGCTNIVGGNGTTYDSNNIGKEYAHIDVGGWKGYLSVAPFEAYAILSSDGTTLTFYYDTQKSSRQEGTVYSLNTGSNKPGWSSNSNITKVVIRSAFKDAYPTSTYYWFANQEHLTTITGISNLNTSEVTNMSSMFDGCSALTSLDVSGFNTSKVTDMNYMFYHCSGLPSLDLSSFNTSKVTDMRHMFDGCSSLTSLDVSSFNTSEVTNMSYMFNRCSDLTSLDVSGFNTSKVTTMSYMFSECYSLPTLDVSRFKTSEVTDMSSMFYRCRSLPTLDVSRFNTSKIKFMNSMFAGCKDLTSLDVSRFNTSEVTNMLDMFDGCSSLTSLNLSSFDTRKVANMSWMFYSANSLITIYVGSLWTTSNLGSDGGNNMFTNCTSLKGGNGTTYDSNNIGKEYAHIDGVGGKGYLSAAPPEAYAVLSSDGKTLTFYYDTNKNSYGANAYALNRRDENPGWYKDFPWYEESPNAITTVVFDSSFKDARPTSTFRWFNWQIKLVTITGISNLNTSEVTDMISMFSQCKILTSLDLSSFDTSNVTDMEYMFQDCSNLTSLNLRYFDTRNVTDMEYMFEGCSSLQTLDLSSFNTTNVTNMHMMFKGCRSLTSLNISSFNKNKVTDMYGMFQDCSSLTGLDLPNFDTSNATDMGYMFYGCSSLPTLDVSRFNTSKVTNMGSMFYGCSGLTSLDLSSFNTSKVTNTFSMFYDDSALTTIYVGNHWTTSSLSTDEGSDMFTNCTNLVGGNGTTYDSNNVGVEYAHIDVDGNPGYLSSKPDNGIATGLESPQDKIQSESWYTIDGRKLNGKPNTKGIVIVNGKKVLAR